MQSLSLRAGCRAAYKGNSGRQKTNDAEVIKKLKLWHAWLKTKFEAYNVLYK